MIYKRLVNRCSLGVSACRFISQDVRTLTAATPFVMKDSSHTVAVDVQVFVANRREVGLLQDVAGGRRSA